MNDLSWPARRQRIWQAVAAVPVGRCASYRRIAEQAGLPRGARLVSRALREATDHGLQLPWHRIVRADRQIGFRQGSASYNEQIGRLADEGVVVCNGKVEQRVFEPEPDLDQLIWRI